MTRVWLRHEGRCWYQCCTPHELSWRDVQAPNSNHSAHSWWPRWSTGAISFRESPFSKWEVGIPNAKQYPVHQHTNTVFENLWDIMRYLSCQTKMATPSSELEWWYLRIHAYCLSNEKTTLHDKMGTFGHADNLGDHPTNLGHVLRLLAGSAKFCVPGIHHNGDGLRTFKGQQNLSGNIVRISHYITLHVRMHA